MELTAIFESWHIGDGNYPPLRRDQLVRLSFELQATRLTMAPASDEGRLINAGNAQYRGVGRVLRRYDEHGSHIAVVETEGFRFYVHGPKAEPLIQGAWVQFEGTLLLDHYLWVEFLHDRPDPPDLFYNLRVTRIRQVKIPERFIQHHAKGISYPTSVGAPDFGTVEELETMEGQDFTLEFYVIDLDDAGLEGLEVSQTFQ